MTRQKIYNKDKGNPSVSVNKKVDFKPLNFNNRHEI
jgi:hypothetical protein